MRKTLLGYATGGFVALTAGAIGLLAFQHHRRSIEPGDLVTTTLEGVEGVVVSLRLPARYRSSQADAETFSWTRSPADPSITVNRGSETLGHVFPDPPCSERPGDPAPELFVTLVDGFSVSCPATATGGPSVRRYWNTGNGLECLVEFVKKETPLAEARRQAALSICDSVSVQATSPTNLDLEAVDGRRLVPVQPVAVELELDGAAPIKLEVRGPAGYSALRVRNDVGQSSVSITGPADGPIIMLAAMRGELNGGCEVGTDLVEHDRDGTSVCRHPDRVVVESAIHLQTYDARCEVLIPTTYRTTVWKRRRPTDPKQPWSHEVDHPLPAAVMSQRIADAKLVCKSMKVLPNEKSTQP